MVVVEDDHVVDAVSAQGSDEAFHEWILPRGSRSRLHLLDAHVIDTAGELVTVDTIAVTEQISRRAVPGKRFHNLLCGPFRTGRLGHVEMDNPSSVVGQDDEDEQHVERHRGHGEEVDGHEVFRMVVEKRSPRL